MPEGELRHIHDPVRDGIARDGIVKDAEQCSPLGVLVKDEVGDDPAILLCVRRRWPKDQQSPRPRRHGCLVRGAGPTSHGALA